MGGVDAGSARGYLWDMDIWTQADINELKAAVRSGVLEVEYQGPPRRRIVYQSLSEMRALLASMAFQVGGTSAVKLATSSKGF